MKIEGHRFLVTGGQGFVGRHLVAELINGGARDAVVYDQGDPASPPTETASGRIAFISGDIRDASRLAAAMAGIDGVFHLAVLPLGACEKDPALAFDVNIRGTFEVIRQALAAGVKKIVYASASSVYGDTREEPDERYPFQPWSMYGVSKLCGEFLLRPTHAKLPYAIVRYMNVYGPGQTAGLIPTVWSRIRSGEPPTIAGDGSASFDFVHVRDVARATLLAMASDVSAEAFNVGSGTEVSVKEIVTLMLSMSGSTLQPVYQPAAAGAMTRRVGSVEKAKRLLGFDARVSLRQGLEEIMRLS